MSEHERLQDMLFPYLTGELDPDERLEIEDHLSSCEECREELQEFRSLHDELMGFAASPHQKLKERVLSRVGGEAESAGRERAWPAWRPAFTAAAVLLVLVAFGSVYAVLQFSGRDYIAGASLSATPLAPGASGDVGMAVEDGGNVEVSLSVSGLPETGPDEYYELWFVRGGERVSAGGFNVDGDGRATVRMNAPEGVTAYPRVGITREEDADPSATTENNVLGGDLSRQTWSTF